MRAFMYKVRNPMGLHSRHAGLLAKEAGKYQTSVTVVRGDKLANGKHSLSLMALGVKKSDVITFIMEGSDEETAASQLQKFVRENF